VPIVAVDWENVKSRLADDTALFALTVRQSAILLSISEQLTWEASFRTNGYDFSDWDTLQSEVADLQAQLAMPVDLSTLIQHVDEIEDLLRLLQSTGDCCEGHDWTGGEGYTVPITEGESNGVPSHLISSGWATDDDDWSGFEEYQCHVAHVLVNNMGHKVVQLLDVFDDAGTLIIGVGAIAGLIALLVGSAATVLVAGILLAAGSASKLWDQLVEGGADIIPDFEEIETARDALVCAWVDPANDGVDSRITALHAAIDTEFSIAEAEILKALMPTEWIRAIYTGQWSDGTTTLDISQRMVDAGIGPGTYTCDCSPQLGEYWHYTEFPGGTQDGWVKNGTPIMGSAYGNPDWGWRLRYDGGVVRISVPQIRQEVGLTSGDPAQDVTVLRVKFDYKCETMITGDLRLSVNSSGTPYEQDFSASLTWVTVDHTLTVPTACLYNGWCVQFGADLSGSGNHIYLDNIGVDFDGPT
jgi:hypothetical protein